MSKLVGIEVLLHTFQQKTVSFQSRFSDAQTNVVDSLKMNQQLINELL